MVCLVCLIKFLQSDEVLSDQGGTKTLTRQQIFVEDKRNKVNQCKVSRFNTVGKGHKMTENLIF